MGLLSSWFRRRASILATLLILALLTATLLASLQLGPSRAGGPAVYTVTIQYFGVDAQEIEQLITVPLEDAMSNLAGIQRLRSISEYGKSIVEADLAPSTVPSRFYLALRDTVNTVYSTLPKAVQRPEILSAGNDQRPFFIATISVKGATLDQTRDYADQNVKPALERMNGVGEVEVAGGSQREVHVVVDQKRAAADGLSVSSVAGMLQQQYLTEPVGLLRTGTDDIPIILHGRFPSIAALAALPLSLDGSRVIRLGEVATVRYGGRELDTVSRIDGKRRVALYAKSAGGANIVQVSHELRDLLASLSSRRVSFDIVYDAGADIGHSLLEVLLALAIAEGIVGLFVAAVLRPLRNAFLVALLLPSVVLASAALLTAFGLTIDENVLSGMAVGVGIVVDPAIVVISALVATPSAHRRGSTAAVVSELIAPLGASAATTLIVLAPLLYMGRNTPALSEVSYSLAAMLLLALAGAILFVPAFVRRRTPPGDKRTGVGRLVAGRQTSRAARRLLAKEPALRPARLPFARKGAQWAARRLPEIVAQWATGHARIVLAGAALVCAAGVIAATRMDLALSAPADSRSVYAHVEYKSGTSIPAIDRRTARLAAQVERFPGVLHVEEVARRGSADITVTLSGRGRDAERVRARLLSYGREVKDAFVYLPEGRSGRGQSIQVSLIGPDNATLRATARKTAELLHGKPWISQVVLNFKPGPPTYVFEADHHELERYGITTEQIASTLRWGMYGPVALKWFEPGSREIDLRVRDESGERGDLREIEGTSIVNGGGRAVPLMQLGSFKLYHPPSRIYRSDRQRAVYFTVESELRSTGNFLGRLQAALDSIQLPTGYAYRIDKEVFVRIRQFHTLTLLLAAALLLIYITLAAQMESLTSSLLLMTIVPVSLAVPVLFLWLTGSGLDVPVIVALIIMSGMVVNNAILILDRTLVRCERLESYSAGEVRRSLRYAVKRRSRALFLTASTTVLGLLPFLFGSTSSSTLFRPLAVVILFGTVASVAATFLVLPAVAAAVPLFVRRFPSFRR